MTDEYIADMITEELRASCPGPNACHGSVGWCPACGTTRHVCDDPECDTHRRETDVRADMLGSEARVRAAAELCIRRESDLIGQERPSADGWHRKELERAVRDFELAEREIQDLEEELSEMRAPGTRLVPRDTRRR